MRIIRLLGSLALWLGALLGIAAGGVWIAGQLGHLQPLIVISGSMEPEIATGDLLLSRPVPTADVEVGDVLSLHSEMTGKLVTHRVVSVAADGDRWSIRMKGDDNADNDRETYSVGDEVLTPWVQIPGAGKVVSKVMEPSVAMPILLALVALLGLSLLDEPPRTAVRRVIDRVRQRDPRVDELDAELAAVGIDVARLREMDDLDLQLYALGIDLPTDTDTDDITSTTLDDTIPIARNGRGFEDGLWDFEMPPSDGLGLVDAPSVSLPTETQPDDTEPDVRPEDTERTERSTPARSG